MDELKVICGDVCFIFKPSLNQWVTNGRIKLTTNELVENFIKYNCERLMNE